MDDRDLAEQLERELQALLRGGQNSPGPNSPGRLDPALAVARRCLSTDFSRESRVREKLLHKLMGRISRGIDQRQGGPYTEAELDEEDLAGVAGGLTGPATGGCTLCGCARAASGILGESCPDCGHSRPAHR